MRIKKLVLFLVVVFVGFYGFTQDSILKPLKKHITKKDFVSGRTYDIDTIIDDVKYYKELIENNSAIQNPQTTVNKVLDGKPKIDKTIPAVNDSLKIITLGDDEYTAKLDKK
ncbi:MAG: hypothetical protein P8H40_02900, partial [Winogradskyella sp.]|nr:hypothetical protein [Winogradskyella sp.]